MFGHLCHYPAGTHPKGSMRQIYDWDSGVYHGEIEEAPVTYNVIGNINEFQLSIGETTYGGREEMVDSTGILDYGSLIYVTLQRAKTAREAISVMTSLVEKYGYNSEGETFSICDPNDTPKELSRYLNAVNYVDKCIGLFIAKLKKSGLFQNSIILISGDHQATKQHPAEWSNYITKTWKSDMSRTPFIIINGADKKTDNYSYIII
jgi:hypothetical protein